MDIKKTFRLTSDEEHQLIQEMRNLGETNFSHFVRRKLLMHNRQPIPQTADQTLLHLAEQTAVATQKKYQEREIVKQLERIFLTLYRIQVLSESSNQVAHEHMKKVMTCFRDLLSEVAQELTLSEEFKEKWL